MDRIVKKDLIRRVRKWNKAAAKGRQVTQQES